MSNAWRVLALLSLAFLLMSMSTDANAARRSALGGNQFIDDSDDMFAFPQLLLKYKNSAIFDFAPSSSYPSSSMEGRGSVTFGDNWAWQFNTGRGDYLDNTASWGFGFFDRDIDNMGGLAGLPYGHTQWWDVGVATTFGEIPVGFTVSVASWNEKYTPDGADPTTDMSENMYSFQLGATWLLDAEWAIEFGTGSYEDKLTTDSKVSLTEFALAVRGKQFEAGGVNWRWMAAFANMSESFQPAGIESSTMTGFRGNFGPVWGTPGDWLIGSYLYFEYVTMKEWYGSQDNDKETYTYFVLPGYNFAMEYYITNWLVARGSVFSHYSHETEKVEGSVGDDGEWKSKYYDFYWTVGLGLDKGTWGLDIALEEDDFHTGYVFSNSEDVDEAFALITAWLRW